MILDWQDAPAEQFADIHKELKEGKRTINVNSATLTFKIICKMFDAIIDSMSKFK